MRERSCIIYQSGNGERLQPFTAQLNPKRFPPAKICIVFGGSLAEGLLKQIRSPCQPGEQQLSGAEGRRLYFPFFLLWTVYVTIYFTLRQDWTKLRPELLPSR